MLQVETSADADAPSPGHGIISSSAEFKSTSTFTCDIPKTPTTPDPLFCAHAESARSGRWRRSTYTDPDHTDVSSSIHSHAWRTTGQTAAEPAATTTGHDESERRRHVVTAGRCAGPTAAATTADAAGSAATADAGGAATAAATTTGNCESAATIRW